MASGNLDRPVDHTAAAPAARAGDDTLVDEVVATVSLVFASVEPTRDDLVTLALRNRARPPVIAALRSLPNRRYRTVRQVRTDLDRLQR